jgi:hypothetical protein
VAGAMFVTFATAAMERHTDEGGEHDDSCELDE